MSDQSTFERVRGILDQIDASPFEIFYAFDLELRGEVLLMSATYLEKDVKTGIIERQRTRKWFISEHATESEIVQTALKCILTSAEHNVREHFSYCGTLVLGPHINISKVLELVRSEEAVDRRK
jgi:hypothetical protein